MPHCIFEYSANIADDSDWHKIMMKVHETLISTGQFVTMDIKSRVVRHENFVIGDGENNQSFVTLDIRILDGRSDDIKNEITKAALEVLVDEFPKSLAEQKCSITVQISEIHRASYQRHVSY
ncbi:MAG: 5-carboxymethyl-2-hydroxymuconate Delta-isomerase [Terracidiphilus sp.]|jgi:5-carboxymethyl-2-hydroxymuconate isomerase